MARSRPEDEPAARTQALALEGHNLFEDFGVTARGRGAERTLSTVEAPWALLKTPLAVDEPRKGRHSAERYVLQRKTDHRA